MLKKALFIYMVLTVLSAKSQEPELPYDFRHHNLTEFNSSLLSPVFSLDRNNPQSVALWTRWQWQTVDSSPTTLFFNYTRKLNNESSIGGGFLQHNTGVFVNTGGVLNYAYNWVLNSSTQLTFGVNVIGFQRKLAEEFIMDPGLPIFEEKNNFILQIAPAVKLQLNAFSFGVAMENFVDRNMTSNEGNASATGLIYMALASYNFPITIFGDSSTSYIRPTLYYKRLPDFDNQIGMNTFFTTPKFWAQVGYNNFYGISTGIGGYFFKKLSLGALVEFGTSSDIKGQDPSFEIVTAFSFGQQVFEAEEEVILETEQEQVNEELAVLEAQMKQDSLAAVKAAEILALEQLQNQKSKDSIATVNQQIELAKGQELTEKTRQDSIALANQQIELAKAQELTEKKKQDSIALVNQQIELAKVREQTEKKRKDSVRIAKEATAIAAIKAEQDKRRIDSLNDVKQAEALAETRKLKEKNVQDSIKALEKDKAVEEVIVLKKGEVYEEVASEEGISEPASHVEKASVTF